MKQIDGMTKTELYAHLKLLNDKYGLNGDVDVTDAEKIRLRYFDDCENKLTEHYMEIYDSLKKFVSMLPSRWNEYVADCKSELLLDFDVSLSVLRALRQLRIEKGHPDMINAMASRGITVDSIKGQLSIDRGCDDFISDEDAIAYMYKILITEGSLINE